MPWSCTWCGQFNKGFNQNQDPAAASAAELAAEVARYGLAPRQAGPGAGDQANPAQAVVPPVLDAVPPVQDAVPPVQDAVPPGSGRRRSRRIALPIAVAVAFVAAASVLLAAGIPRASGMTDGRGGATRAVNVTVSHVATIELQGVSGQLAIAGTTAGQVALTGQLNGTGGAPVIESRLDRASGVLAVDIRCAHASPCTQNLRLAVPAATSAIVRQPGGRVVVTDLAGPLRITAANVDISATGLRSHDLAATITNGHLSAAFTAPPCQVSIALTSAQATLRMPTSAAYRVSQQVMSGYIRVAVPQAYSDTHTVTARIDSGELQLLPWAG